MTAGLAGRGIAMVGIITGLLAVGLVLISAGNASASYLDHGVVVIFVIALLAMASYLPAEVGYDTAGAAAGTTVFGFFLFIPAGLAFDRLGSAGPAAWLGLCTVLIPIGWAVVRSAEGAHATAARTGLGAARDPQLWLAVSGVILLAAGIWLPVITNGPTFWHASTSGDALGILLLAAVLANAATLLGPVVYDLRVSGDAVLLLACATFGLAAAAWLEFAFDRLGALGSGGWLEAVGALLLLVGVVAARLSAERAPSTDALAVAP